MICVEEAPAARRVSPIVKVWVLAHMVLVLSWCLPLAAPAVLNGSVPPTPANIARHPIDFLLASNNWFKNMSPTSNYLTRTGIWQYWDMFAPNPANVDFWWDAIVTYQSGKIEVVPYPRMKALPLFEKYFKERYRKYLERMNNDKEDSWKRPVFAQRMALLAFKDPKDPPVKVQLRRHWKEMKSMDTPVPEKYNEYVLFSYIIDQNKLRQDAGR